MHYRPRITLRRIVKRIVLGLLAFVVVVGVATGGTFYYFTRQSFPQIDGTLNLPGLSGDVTIIRDQFGVPQIYADTSEDLFRAEGFVHAQDRYFQMEFQRRIGEGRLSELFGASALPQDKTIRMLGWNRTATAEVATLTPEARTMLEAYSDGVNAYALANPDKLSFEFRILGLIGRPWKPEAWKPADSLAWGEAMAWDLSSNMDQEQLRAALIARGGQDLANTLLPSYPPDAPVIVPSPVSGANGSMGAMGQGKGRADALDAPTLAPTRPRSYTPTLTDVAPLLALYRQDQALAQVTGLTHDSEIGSNNWVIGPARTTTGSPLLANDPHLGLMMPSIWYQVGLHCRTLSERCPYDVVGVSFPGAPGVIIGHNNRIAWGVTSAEDDVQDLYIEHANPANPNEFEYQGHYEPAQVVTETINVAGQDKPVVLHVRITRHGPIINDAGDGSSSSGSPLYALRWTGMEPNAIFQSVLMLDRAQNWDDFRNALHYWDVPAQNFVYADVDGNIGYQMPGRVPIRLKGDGSIPVPGWTGEYEWAGYIPFDQLPSLYNPPDGYIATANNAIVDSKYPYLIAKDWDYGYRARRIRQMILAKPKLSLDDMKQMQADTQSLFAGEVLPYLEKLDVSQEGKPIQDALAALKQWNQRSTRGSVGSLIFETFWLRLAHTLFDRALGKELSDKAISTGTATKTALRNVLADPSSHWWSDAARSSTASGTPDARDTVLLQTLRDTVATLQARYGTDMKQWLWGRVHTVTFTNQTLGKSGIPVIESIFNRGPYAVDGAPADVDNTAGDESMQVTSGPSWRMIVDLGDFSRSVAIHTTGQSGHVYNPHYDDMIRPWLEVQYHPLFTTRDDILSKAEGTLTLRP